MKKRKNQTKYYLYKLSIKESTKEIIYKKSDSIKIKKFLLENSWNQINDDILITMISKLKNETDIEFIKLLIDKAFQIRKYKLIETIYNISCDEQAKKTIIFKTRNFIKSGFTKEDIYETVLEARDFLGILCDETASTSNLTRSFNVLNHIKVKKDDKII